MRRLIPTLGLVALVAAGCNEGTKLPPEETPTSVAAPQLEYLVDPSLVPTTRAERLPLPAPLASVVAASEQGDDVGAAACTTVDFEGATELVTPTADGMTFGSSWVALIDSDAGGIGPIANEPSPSTVALVMDNDDADIALASPAAMVSLFYSASEQSLPLTLQGLDGDGAVVAEVEGSTLGFVAEGCGGDDDGSYCIWDSLQMSTEGATIETIRILGAPMLYAIDDLQACGAADDGGDGGGDGGLTIDIKPGNELNTINPAAEGKVAVAVLGSEDLDVTQIDIESVTLGDGEDPDTPVARKGGDEPMAQLKDADHDGIVDLLLHFDVGQLVENGDLDWNTEELVLQAQFLGNDEGGTASATAATGRMSGSDVVHVVNDGSDGGAGTQNAEQGKNDHGLGQGNGQSND